MNTKNTPNGVSPNPEYEQPINSSGDNVNKFKYSDNIKGVASAVPIKEEIDENNFGLQGYGAWSNYSLVFENTDKNKDFTLSCKILSELARSTGVNIYGTNVLTYTTSDLETLGMGFVDIASNVLAGLNVSYNSGNYQYLVFRFWTNRTGTALSSGVMLYFNDIKLEKGSKATPYTPYGMGCINEKIVGQQLFQLEYIPVPSSPINAFVKKGTYAIATCDGATFNKNIYIKLFNKKKEVVKTKGHIITGANLSFSDSSYNYYGAAGLSSFIFTIDDDYYLSIGLLDSDNTRQIMLVQGSTIIREYQDYQNQNFTIPTQQPMRSIGNIRDFFFKNTVDSEYYDSTLTENAWFEKHLIFRYFFTGEETLKLRDYGNNTVNNQIALFSFDLPFTYDSPKTPNIMCNSFINLGSKSGWAVMKNNDVGIALYYQNQTVAYINTTVASNVTDFKTFLAEKYANGNPVYIDYPLESPINIPCTEAQTEALEAYIKARTYKNVTHFYSEDETPSYKEVVYYKDLLSYLDTIYTRK